MKVNPLLIIDISERLRDGLGAYPNEVKEFRDE